MQIKEYQKQPSFAQNYHTGQSPINKNNINNNASPKSTLKSDVIISPQQMEKQNQLTKALLRGDVEIGQKAQKYGTDSFFSHDKDGLYPSFLYKDKDGLYPLVAAVYGCSLQLVRYIERKLKDGAAEQWARVDTKEFANKLNSQFPTKFIKSVNRRISGLV